MPIWVGPHEGLQILQPLRQFPTTRPLAFQLMAQLVQTLDATVEAVQIEILKDDTYYATVQVRNSAGTHSLDARPSDAIALALTTQSPIYVTEEVMAFAADLPDDFDNQAWRQMKFHHLADLEAIYGIIKAWRLIPDDEIARFTKRARRAWTQAEDEARQLNHDYIGTEHLLLGILNDEEGVGFKVLHELGIERAQVVEAVARLVGSGATALTNPPTVTERTRYVIELAAEERRILGHRYLGTEHLILGLVREDKSAAARVLRDLGLNLNRVRPHIIDHFINTRIPADKKLTPLA